jgi:hypothetical protein
MRTLPPYAGLVDLDGARKDGLGIQQAASLLHRIAYAKQRLAITAAMFLPSIPEWEAKCALALHGWIDGEHAAMLYGRIAEMREPPPGPWDVPDPRLEAAFDELLAAGTSAARLSAIYAVVRPAVREAIERYVLETNPLCDQPTARLFRFVMSDEIEAIAPWAEAAVSRYERDDEARDWTAHMRRWIDSAGGVSGSLPAADTPAARFLRPYTADILPRRDGRFTNIFDTSTPADIVYLDESRGADERNAALMFKRLREMDVPEVVAGIVAEHWIAERNGNERRRPWSYYAAMLRQMWDEARHAMLGQALLESRGIDWAGLPVNVTFSWKLARHCSALERHVLLYAIEQSLMPRDRGKPYEHRVAAESGDRLSMLFHDFDWADEVLHVDIARRCLKPELAGGLNEARRQADALWERIAEALARDPMPVEGAPDGVRDWWPRFAKQVLGRDVDPVPETDVKNWRPLD